MTSNWPLGQHDLRKVRNRQLLRTMCDLVRCCVGRTSSHERLSLCLCSEGGICTFCLEVLQFAFGGCEAQTRYTYSPNFFQDIYHHSSLHHIDALKASKESVSFQFVHTQCHLSEIAQSSDCLVCNLEFEVRTDLISFPGCQRPLAKNQARSQWQ